MIGYVKCFDNNKTMSFRVTDHNLLETYAKIWRRVSNSMKIEFDGASVHGDIDKYIKTKLKMHGNKVNANFKGKMSKEKASNDCLSLITLDFVIRVNKKYYPQILLEECKYKINKNERDNLINDGLELDTDSESYNEFNSESGSD